MPSVVWVESALEDLHAIAAFIAERDPQAAHRLVERLMDDADALAVLPVQYRRGRVAGTHELVCHPNYILVYRHAVGCIEILNVLHARQRYPT
ncbi:MAG: type II toxin-antitoxin system RelE/ParE family toxin [Acidovorax sp.]|uniref:type II toxin-antitoxin system RelE/ParE family toxin n=1 Tax=Acidovorax sp. TaxID=1872122 RepID=UPI0039E29886